ncbi:MAG: Type IV-A pilus assembly ATPase PilB [uncultured bacterium (gcode 4)]|uniref:Type IV-A pilus assembly ATPase PilB n=1 Tax=uncultured bacterium (gcode 4) TaxID=1234023 RepID=K2FG73_9BACT|nr:MAG: Type IV-A pilus assembly ATPase PilB [uncultured bacterium (gcode 4)]
MKQLDILNDEIYKGDNAQRICDLIIASAVESWSSDIHIEPLSNVVRVRFRVDWILKVIVEYQTFIHPQIVARYKILSNLKIDESRMPQDGRISTVINDKWLDLRVSTLPTVHWEKIVMRIVDKSKKVPPLEVLWIEWHNWDVLEKAISQPNWIVLTSGPTWSGKSTTLYSCLMNLNTPDVNIMTLEDPVENTLDWVNQSQVFPDIGYSFASGLRTALRQDPDIIMVWEIRDKETINIAIEASLTWHLVLSTIHTNSAAETLTRILNMWIPAFLLPASINAIMAQRLIRRLCKHCKKAITVEELDPKLKNQVKKTIWKISKEELTRRVPAETLKNPLFYVPVWCEHCDDTWYSWRVWIYEVMEITPILKEYIIKGESSVAMNDAAIEWWMISLEMDWIMKALNWMTSLEESYWAVKEN